MPQVEMGNIYYFGYIALAIILIVIAVKFLDKKTQVFRHWFVFGLIMTAFSIHFLKILIYPYTTVEHVWTKVSFENICAVSTLVFPFVYFSKNKTLRDYMVMVAMASGIVTFIFPIDAMSSMFDGAYLGARGAFQLEVFRFYLAHFLLFLAPFLMLRYKMHSLSITRAYRAPFVLIFVLFLIFINELILTLINWVPKEHLFSPEHRNPSFIFGVRGDLTKLGLIIGVFVPMVFRINPIIGAPGYWPVVWLIIPVLVYGSLFVLLFMFIYDNENTKRFFLRILKINRGAKQEIN